VSEDWMRWYDHSWARPFVLSRWTFMRKHWHPGARRLARWRSLYWTLLRRWDSEICARCGSPVRVVFHVPDAIWECAAGFAVTKRDPGGEAAPGVLCVSCVTDLAREAGLPYLRWTCSTDDSGMVG
jgi:hypothetical protein